MAAHFQHLWGEMQRATIDGVGSLLAELRFADDEHPDVAVVHESGWALSVYREGFVVWGNVGAADNEDRHIHDLAEADVVRLMEAVVRGELDRVHALAWQPGYGA